MAQLDVKLVRSLVGAKKTQIAVAESLGLRKIGDVTTQPDNDATRGKVFKLSLIHISCVTATDMR